MPQRICPVGHVVYWPVAMDTRRGHYLCGQYTYNDSLCTRLTVELTPEQESVHRLAGPAAVLDMLPDDAFVAGR